jgi:hypothetical protein
MKLSKKISNYTMKPGLKSYESDLGLNSLDHKSKDHKSKDFSLKISELKLLITKKILRSIT